MTLIENTESGIYCPLGDFYVDPWQPVPRAVVTHAHSDHARYGCGHYLVAREGVPIFRQRLGAEAVIDSLDYAEQRRIGDVHVSLFPAGHMTGSAQVRIEHRGEVWVVSGDYKLHSDPTCAAFEPVQCHTFVTESTFGLPIFRWEDPDLVIDQIQRWWCDNQETGRASVIFAYSIGKAQRLLSLLDASIGPIVGHEAIVNACRAYSAAGVKLPLISGVSELPKSTNWSAALIIAPPRHMVQCGCGDSAT